LGLCLLGVCASLALLRDASSASAPWAQRSHPSGVIQGYYVCNRG